MASVQTRLAMAPCTPLFLNKLIATSLALVEFPSVYETSFAKEGNVFKTNRIEPINKIRLTRIIRAFASYVLSS